MSASEYRCIREVDTLSQREGAHVDTLPRVSVPARQPVRDNRTTVAGVTDRQERAMSFGSIAENYDGLRPQAPQQARDCGSCTSCCTLLEVTDAGKAVNEWCKFCVAGKGCTIYEQRPQMCRSFSCAWVQGHLGDEWFPDTARFVVHLAKVLGEAKALV